MYAIYDLGYLDVYYFGAPSESLQFFTRSNAAKVIYSFNSLKDVIFS